MEDEKDSYSKEMEKAEIQLAHKVVAYAHARVALTITESHHVQDLHLSFQVFDVRTRRLGQKDRQDGVQIISAKRPLPGSMTC